MALNEVDVIIISAVTTFFMSLIMFGLEQYVSEKKRSREEKTRLLEDCYSSLRLYFNQTVVVAHTAGISVDPNKSIDPDIGIVHVLNFRKDLLDEIEKTYRRFRPDIEKRDPRLGKMIETSLRIATGYRSKGAVYIYFRDLEVYYGESDEPEKNKLNIWRQEILKRITAIYDELAK